MILQTCGSGSAPASLAEADGQAGRARASAEDLNFVQLEESFRDDSPRTVFYTWKGSDSLEDVEITVRVELGGNRLQVRQSWATWHGGEMKGVQLPSHEFTRGFVALAEEKHAG
jgi:hypothetical protein